MSRAFEIIIPHRASNPANAAALEICRARLTATTPPRLAGNLKVTVDTREELDPYLRWNECAQQSTADVLVLMNDDMIAGHGWHAMLDAWRAIPHNSIVTGYMVEPGHQVPVNYVNDQADLGRDAESFDAAGFDRYVAARAPFLPHIIPGMGWYQPFAISRTVFVEQLKGFDLGKGAFPDPLDVEFINRARASGCQMLRANSWWYHFQRTSGYVHGNVVA